MSWISWTSLVPTFLILSASVAWWFTEPKNARINLIAAAGAALFCWAVAPELCRELSYWAYTLTVDALAALRLDLVIAKHANMLLMGAAVVWTVQTLWKPVPELINILGVDVPEPPDVSLADIRADAATVNWTRPPANRSVQKFLIQVNGVVVGDVAANQEPAIVVSGLKPDHFYNVRVIAVGSNNFQAGSRVIRLRTFGRDGRPQLGNSRLPANFTPEDLRGSAPSEMGDESGGGRSPFPALEVPTVPEAAPSPSRDSLAPTTGPRRNTVTRRHSPSTTSLDQSIREEVAVDHKQTLPELTEKFESIRKETEDVVALIAKEEADNRSSLEELEAEKRGKRKEQKKKEEQTEKLKRDVNSTDRSMRNAMQRKAQKEKLLKEKQAERSKFHDNIAKWERGVEEMRRDRENFDQQRTELEEERDQKLEQSQAENGDLQTECSRLETELKEVAREMSLAQRRKEWFRGQAELQEALAFEAKRSRGFDEQIRILNMHLQHIPQPPYGMYNQPNTSALDIDHSTVTQLKRRSRAGNSLSNGSISTSLPPYSQIDPAGSAPTGFASSRSANAPPGFAPGPFMDLSADIGDHPDELHLRTAPLSPSAAALLPSNILADIDDDEPSPVSRYAPDSFFAQQRASPDNAPQSPASSGKSFGIFSSPHGSTSNLPFPAFQDTSDRLSLNGANTIPSPVATEPPPNKLSSFFLFQRSRQAKATEKDGLPFGSMKPGQSQSFPRQDDDLDGLANKRRKSLSGSSWNVFNRNPPESEVSEGHALTSRMFSRSLNPFSSSHRGSGGLFPERDPSSPRPASIASSEFPRPSTESSRIWGPPGGELGKSSRLWSPDAPWSRAPSRRPSLHGSPSALKTTLASADDEILGEEMLPNVSEVGVIGSRPPTQSNKAALARLNPNAPAFIGSLFKSKPEKEKEREGRDKAKAEKKDKGKGKDSKEKSKSREATSMSDTPVVGSLELESPLESRRSRDGLSVHTQTSVSESRDSLSLDQPFSNTSEATSGGLSSSFKEDNVVRKLFRKGSSSKFSLAGRLGGKESGLFKKGPSSTASGGASDKGTSMELSSIGDFEDIGDDALNLSFLGRSYDSITSSPSLAPTVSAKSKENKTPVRWLSNFGKKGKKERESLDVDRAQFSELDGLAEESQKS
ncbi:hypothetical protein N0V88_004631 [Collariella sp. IMI 366227]|nr:hypothetical protein N0V88_004631 [Collariella sp. IMI 366227]